MVEARGRTKATMDEQQQYLAHAEQVVIDAIGRAMALYGLPVALGRIYGLLYLADTPLKVTDIADQLGITKGMVSINVRLLERVRMVRQVWTRGRRGKFYVAERDYQRALTELLRTTAAAELATVTTALAESDRLLGAVEAGPDTAARERARAHRAKIAALRDHYETSYRLLQSFVEAMAGGQPSQEAR
jgi:DNA-binding transcriptional regulator GbsR (MarR family)